MKISPEDFVAEVPYYQVMFISIKKNDEGYAATAQRMVERSASYPGFLGIESFTGEEGKSMTVCYWKDEASLKAWYADEEHRRAQEKGKQDWYQYYRLRISKVERDYSFGSISK